MSEQSTICKEGIVKAVHNREAEVEIIVSSACAGCHAKSICIPSDHRQETIVAVVPEDMKVSVGERVNLNLRGRAGGKAVVLAYLLPFCVLMLAFLASYLLFHNELVSYFI